MPSASDDLLHMVLIDMQDTIGEYWSDFTVLQLDLSSIDLPTELQLQLKLLG